MSTSVNPYVKKVYKKVMEKKALFDTLPPPDSVYQLLDQRKIAL